MIKHRVWWALLAFLFIGNSSSPHAAVVPDFSTLTSVHKKQSAKKYKPGQLVVKFKKSPRQKNNRFVPTDTGLANFNRFSHQHKIKKMNRVFRDDKRKIRQTSAQKKIDAALVSQTFLLDVDATTDGELESLAKKLSESTDVIYAEPNHIYRALVVPNDPKYPIQWGLQKISLPVAWDMVQGAQESLIAIVDSGVDYNHPDLKSKTWTNPGETGVDGSGHDKQINGIDDDNNGFIDDVRGWNFSYKNNDPKDDNGHGTHVAGVAAGVANNGEGIAGVSWNSKIMCVKALDVEGNGGETELADAVRYAYRSGAKVINNSWGGSKSELINEAINQAIAAGVTVVCAAGNSHTDDIGFSYPAALPNVISVAATDQNDRKSMWGIYGSNFGRWVTISAPGTDILSTFPTYPVYLNQRFSQNYASLNGTSMACPTVAGVAGLLLSKYPDLSPEQVKQAISNSADNIDSFNPNYLGQLGGGRINAEQALRLVGQRNSLSGVVTGQTGESLSDVNISLLGDSLDTQTLTDGSFNFPSIPAKRYLVVPSKADYFFTPPFQQTSAEESQTKLNFSAQPWLLEPVSAAQNSPSAVAFLPSGDPAIVFIDKVSGHIQYGIFDGARWIYEAAPVDSETISPKYFSLKIDSSGNPHISYYDSLHGDLLYATKTNGSWSKTVIDSEGDVGVGTDLQLDESNNTYIAYYDMSNKTLKIVRKLKGVWNQPAPVDKATLVSGYSMVVRGSYPYVSIVISYGSYPNGNITQASRFEDSAWSYLSTEYGYHPRVAMDERGTTSILYRDLVNNLVLAQPVDDGQWRWKKQTINSSINSVVEEIFFVYDAANNPVIVAHDGGMIKIVNKINEHWFEQTIGSAITGSIAFAMNRSQKIALTGKFQNDSLTLALNTSMFNTQRYSIRGTVRDIAYQNLSDAVVTLTGAENRTISTIDGHYEFLNLPHGKYSISVNKEGFLSFPRERAYSPLMSSLPAQDFSMQKSFSISGTLKDETGRAVQGATVLTSGFDQEAVSATSDATGAYILRGLISRDTVIKPSKEETRFKPEFLSLPPLTSDLIGQDFVSWAGYRISGVIRDFNGGPLTNVDINLMGPEPQLINTGGNSSYRFNHMGNDTYTVIPSKAGYEITPAHQTFDPLSNNEDNTNFSAEKFWDVQTLDDINNTGFATSLALDQAGHPHIAYVNRSTARLKYAHWTGSSWEIKEVDNAAIFTVGTSIVIDSKGLPHIAYYDMTAGALKYASWNGTTWIIEKIDTDQFAGFYPCLKLDSAERPHISYGNFQQMKIKYAHFNGSKWEVQDVEKIGDGVWDGLVKSGLALDKNNHPHIVWFDTLHLKYGVWDGTRWTITSPDTKNYSGYAPSLVLDNLNRPHISYEDLGHFPLNQLRYAVLKNSVWDIQVVDDLSAFDDTNNSITLDARQHSLISYFQAGGSVDGGGVLAVAQWNGSSWDKQRIEKRGTNGSGSSVMVDSSGRVHITYNDSSKYLNGTLKYARSEHVGPNRAPIINDERITLIGMNTLHMRVLDNDFDPDGDSLTVKAVTQPECGSVDIRTPGRIGYLEFDATGCTPGRVIEFNYDVADVNGGTATGHVRIYYEMEGGVTTNHVPKASDQQLEIVSVNAIGVHLLATDQDSDLLEYFYDDPENEGRLTNTVGPNLNYQPKPIIARGEEDRFQFRVYDGMTFSGFATIKVIKKVNPPSISSMTPSGSPVVGGTTIQIYGADFQPGAAVKFGNNPAVSLSFIDSSHLTAVVPPANAETVTVEVLNPDGQSGSKVKGFVYFSPLHFTVTVDDQVSPLKVYEDPTELTIRFKDIVKVIPNFSCAFPTKPQNSSELLDAALGFKILRWNTAVARAGSSYVIEVGYKNGNEIFDSHKVTITIPANPPTIISVTPNVGPVEGGTRVDIKGMFLNPRTEAFIGGNKAQFLAYSIETMTLSVLAPAGMAGPADVEVRNGDVSGILKNGFTYQQQAPIILSATPDSQPANGRGGASTTIKGILIRKNTPEKFSYQVDDPGFIKMVVMDRLGRVVIDRVLSANTAGTYTETLDGLDDRGSQLPSGTYFVRIFKDSTVIYQVKAVVIN